MASLNTLDIPMDTTIHHNDIKNHIALQFKTIHNHEEIDQLLVSTPSTWQPIHRRTIANINRIRQLHLVHSRNIGWIRKLRHFRDIRQYQVTPTEFKKEKKGTINNKGTIPLKEFKQGYKKWKERTTASLSGRHLRHYHTLLAPDGEEKESTFSDDM